MEVRTRKFLIRTRLAGMRDMSIQVTSKDGSVQVSHTGCTLKTYGESVQVMSDIYEYHTYALVFDNDSGEFKSVFLTSDYPSSSGEKRVATVDATEEVKALYEAHEIMVEAKKALDRAEARRADKLAEVRTPGRGKTLKVVKGRKVPVGTVGECTWYGEGRSYSPFRSSYRNAAPGPMRVGIKVNGEVVYTDARNVEVVVG